MTTIDKLNLVDRARIDIPLTRQAELLDVSRSRLYYQTEVSERNLCLMNLIDAIYTEHPTYGKRTIAAIIRRDNKIMVGKKHVRRLMVNMGIMAIYPRKKRDLSQPNKQHKIYPYLLRGLAITRVNQVWSTDITYIRLEHGFCYLVAIIDWYSRRVIAWELSNTLDIDFCLRVLERAYALGAPEIFNSDQGSHFTSPRFTALSIAKGVKISMDGRGRCLDNVFIERLWRTVKQEDIYIRHYESVTETRIGLTQYFNDYNSYRPHQSLNNLTPDEVYFSKYKKTAFTKQLNILNLNLNTVPTNPTF